VGFHGSDVHRLERDAAGKRLILDILTTNGSVMTWVISTNGSQLRRVGPGYATLTEDGHLICSHIGGALVFASGLTIELTPSSRYGFSPDKSLFFFLHDFTAGAAIFRSVNPHEVFAQLPRDFYPSRIFNRGNEIFVFGERFKTGKPTGRASGLVYSTVDQQPRMLRRIDLSRFGGVRDMDPAADFLLVVGRRDKFNTWGIFDMHSGKHTALGRVPGYALFLDAALVKSLEGIWGINK
jgi:hypothetical protein